MDASAYHVVFDISAQHFALWPYFAVAVVASAGFAWAFFPTRENHQTQISAFSLGCFALLFGCGLGYRHIEFVNLQAQMREERYSVVEGVPRYIEMATNHSRNPDRIELAGRHFSIGNAPPAYSRKVSAGGPNLSGQCVKIAYNEHRQILWLGILKIDDWRAAGCG